MTRATATAATARWALRLGIALAALSLALPAWAGRRFAVLAANNEGGPGTRPLRWAHEDARRMQAVLTRLGAVDPSDALLLLDRTADDLRRALDGLEPRLRESASRGEQPLLVVYYSGHAKDGALRMGETGLPLDELRGRMAASAAAVRIGLFDSCRSGAITRAKGARRAPAFDVDLGQARAARGLVLLTSSAADEDSQESEELGGSFFSHHLASGLMGGADSSGDGRVTLSEAYAYAYARTVADTAETAAGAQHPTFAYDLAGNGDVVLTDVARRGEGVLVPAEAPPGSWFLVDERGAVAAELAKAEGVACRAALAPGTYRVRRRLSDRLRVGSVEVRSGQVAVLADAALRDAPFSDDPIKGVSRRFEPETRAWMGASLGWQGFFAGPFPSMPLASLELSLRDGLREGWGLGFDAALGGGSAAVALPDGALPYRFAGFGFGATLERGWPMGRLTPFAGGRLQLVGLARSFDDPRVPGQGYFVLTPGLVGGLRFRLGDRWEAVGRGRLHYLYYSLGSDRSVGFLEGSVLLSREL